MIIAPTKVHTEQKTLWPWVGDRKIDGRSSARHFIGEFFEEATRVLTGAQKHECTGRADICPDFSFGENEFLEVKSFTNGAVIFKHRFENDLKLIEETWGWMTYVYWLHNTKMSEATTLHELRRRLAASTKGIIVLPITTLKKYLRKKPTVMLQYNQGMEYKPAWRLSRADLDAMAPGKRFTLNQVIPPVYGNHIGTIPIRGPDIGRLFRPLTSEQRQTANDMLADLSQSYLEVGVVPAERPMHPGHKVRQVFNANPAWYGKLCAEYPCKRKIPRTKRGTDSDIRRQFVLESLSRLSRGVCRFEYDWRLRPFVEQLSGPKEQP